MRGADLLLRRLDQLRELRRQRQQDVTRCARIDRLTAWQGDRLARTHDDLLANPRYRSAVEFFLSDLYTPQDLSHRDRKLARISPTLSRVLSDQALRTMGLALEMNVVTEELDAAMEEWLTEDGFPERLTEPIYVRAYRLSGNADKRRRQIELIREVGEDLDEIVTRPWIRRALQMAGGPARMSGLGDMHTLLERGFEAFRRMRGAQEFLDTIVGRELEIMQRIYDRHPRPFEIDKD